MSENAVATVDQVAPSATSIIQVIERAASNPNVDIDKMERLLQMQERILDRQAEADFAAAMTRVQALLPVVMRDAKNSQTNSRYSRLETIARSIKPIYTAEGFSVTFSEADSPKADHIRVAGILRHRSGHKEFHHADVPIDAAGIKGNVNKTLTHATGSTFSYGRRYLTCLMFDVATGDDDDGNAAGGGAALTLTAEQVAALDKLLAETGSDKARFLAFAKVESLNQILAKNFDAVCQTVRNAARARQRQESK